MTSGDYDPVQSGQYIGKFKYSSAVFAASDIYIFYLIILVFLLKKKTIYFIVYMLYYAMDNVCEPQEKTTELLHFQFGPEV